MLKIQRINLANFKKIIQIQTVGTRLEPLTNQVFFSLRHRLKCHTQTMVIKAGGLQLKSPHQQATQLLLQVIPASHRRWLN